MDAASYDQLRVELKTWEKNFIADNGRKPKREDIKSNTAIAAKYKLFNLSRPAKPAREPTETPKKRSQQRKHSNEALRERPQNIAANTPRKDSRTATAAEQQALSPVKEEQPTPAFIRSALGPTPQKDGHVLGIFDMLPSGTPSKPSPDENLITATPSKAIKTAPSDPALSRTPQSSSKRYYLDAFVGTPMKRKRDDGDVGTPNSVKKMYATPSFLRRSTTLAPIEESSVAESSAMPPPFRKRGMVRSLSNMIQNLKKQEEEDMDDDWDIMNELEAEERGESVPKPAKKPIVQVEDSQGVEMPLGPDQGPEESESEEEAPLGRDGLPRKAWKKKGLKRQTKRVKMKARPHKAGKERDLADDESSESDNGDKMVAETQLTGALPAPESTCDRDDDKSGSEYGGADGESKAPVKVKKKPKRTEQKKGEAEGVVEKVVRKVSASAHANFKKLKIKNKNSKAGGRGGRFGRR